MKAVPPEGEEEFGSWLDDVLSEYLKRGRAESAKAAAEAIAAFSKEVGEWIQSIDNRIKKIKVDQHNSFGEERVMRASTPNHCWQKRGPSQPSPLCPLPRSNAEPKRKLNFEAKRKAVLPQPLPARSVHAFPKLSSDISVLETTLKELESRLLVQVKRAEEDKKTIAEHKERIAALEAAPKTIKRSASFEVQSSRKWFNQRTTSGEKPIMQWEKPEAVSHFARKQPADIDLLDFDFSKTNC